MAFIECHCCNDKHHIELLEKFPFGEGTYRKLDTNLPQWEVKCPKGNGSNFVDVNLKVVGTNLQQRK